MSTILEMHSITKTFGSLTACDGIDIDLKKGEVLTLLGENGAGKSTLMNILYGLLPFDSGQIILNGQEIHFKSPNDAMACGIGMVHQHFMLIDVFTVAENIILGTKINKFGVLQKHKLATKIREISKQFGLEIEPNTLVRDLPVGLKQRVEIIKALYKKANILILDEPTAVLTPKETRELFAIVRRLKAEGKSVIFISHKLKEIIEISDRVIILRQGKKVGVVDNPNEAKPQELANMMVGRDIRLTVEKDQLTAEEKVILKAKNLNIKGALHGLSLDLYKGVIHGIAGVQGNGQTQLCEALMGLTRLDSGEICIEGKQMKSITPRIMHEQNVCYIPEDRQKHGLVLDFPLHDNFMLNSYYREPFSTSQILNHKVLHQITAQEINRFSVKAGSIFDAASSLSGGNQQKLIIAREFFSKVKIMIASNPTRGIDVGSIEYIHEKIVELQQKGAAILLISTELDEILSLSDIVSVIYKGSIVASFPRKDASREKIGLFMTGGAKKEKPSDQV